MIKSSSSFLAVRPSFLLHWWQRYGISPSSPTGVEIFRRRRCAEISSRLPNLCSCKRVDGRESRPVLSCVLEGRREAFYHQQPETVRKSFSELSKALKQRYEGGLALLKYKRDFNSRSRKEGEPLHSYLADLRITEPTFLLWLMNCRKA